MSHDEPKLSIILCSYNEQHRLQGTVDSILKTTSYSDIEVVVVDNRSTDGSFDFVVQEPYASNPRVIPVQNLENLGVARGRHSGTLAASGDIFIFLDAHMVVQPQWCRLIARNFREIEGLGALSLKCYDIDQPEHGKTRRYSVYSNRSYLFNSPTWVGGFEYTGPRKVPFVNGGTICISRNVYEEVGGFPQFLEGWGHDDVGLSLLVYYHGHDCYLDSRIAVGHYYKSVEDQEVAPGAALSPERLPTYWTLYNAIAFAYVLLDEEGFERAIDKARKRSTFHDSHAHFLRRRQELNLIKQRLRKRATRSYADFTNEFEEYLAYRFIGAYERGVHLVSKTRFAEARARFQYARRLSFSYGKMERQTYQRMVAFRAAESYFFEGSYREFLRLAFEGLQESPRYVPLLKRIGQAYYYLKDYQKSLFWYRVAESNLPNREEQENELSYGDFKGIEGAVHEALAMVLYHRRDYRSAIAHLQKALNEQPEDERLLKNLALFQKQL